MALNRMKCIRKESNIVERSRSRVEWNRVEWCPVEQNRVGWNRVKCNREESIVGK